jgi:hypothetical protein
MDRPTVRVVAGVLWFLAIWTTGAFADAFLGVPEAIGFLLGLVVGGVIVLNVRREGWPRWLAGNAPSSAAASGAQPLPGGRVLPPGSAIAEHSATADTAPAAAGIDR